KTLPWLHRNPPEKKRNVEILFGQLVPGFVDRYASRLGEAAEKSPNDSRVSRRTTSPTIPQGSP
ncbi:MAG: hypothetical protein EBQ75_08735, partial [Actinobacteria bacterium]|nr:hypothetical protein [Actinomycetota bacterium]